MGSGNVVAAFSGIDDPRSASGKRHDLMDIIATAICAVICGAEGWADVELFGKSKKDWLTRFLKLSNGIPSHDTFGRVFSLIAPSQFQRCFMNWVSAMSELTREK